MRETTPVWPATDTRSPTRKGRTVNRIAPLATLDRASRSASAIARPAVDSTASVLVIETPTASNAGGRARAIHTGRTAPKRNPAVVGSTCPANKRRTGWRSQVARNQVNVKIASARTTSQNMTFIPSTPTFTLNT